MRLRKLSLLTFIFTILFTLQAAGVSASAMAFAGTPTATIDYATVNQGSSTYIDLLGNDTDSAGGYLYLVSCSNPSHGQISSINTNSRGVTYTPAYGYYGTDYFSYVVASTSGGSTSGFVSITVNGSSSNNGTITINNDTVSTSINSQTAISPLANDHDNYGYSLNLVSVTNPSHGNAYISGNSVYYTPTTYYTGTDSFTYTVSNGHGNYGTGTITVNIGTTNGGTLIANPDNSSSTPGTPTYINVLSNDTTTNGYALTLQSVTTPSHGNAYVSGNNVIYTPITGYYGTDNFYYTVSNGITTAQGYVTVNVGTNYGSISVGADSAYATAGTATTINALLNDSDSGYTLTLTGVSTPAHGSAYISGTNIIYTPVASYSGTDTFTYTVSSARGTTATGTVTVTVSPAPVVNSAPVANNDTATTNKSTPVTVDVLNNDTDANSDPLSISSVIQGTSGTATIGVSGKNIVYTPKANFVGTDYFYYIVSDGKGGTSKGMVTVTVKDTAASTSTQPATSSTPASTTGGKLLAGAGIFKAKDGTFVNHVFMLHSPSNSSKDNLNIVWVKNKKTYSFQLKSLSSMNYSSDLIYNVAKGSGTGTLNGAKGYKISFIFKDGSAKGYGDISSMLIMDAKNKIILNVYGTLSIGDYCAE